MKSMLKTVVITATIIATPTFIFAIAGWVLSDVPWSTMHILLKDAFVIVAVSAAVAVLGIFGLRRIEFDEDSVIYDNAAE